MTVNVSQRRASRAPGLPRSGLRYSPVVGDERAALARRIEVNFVLRRLDEVLFDVKERIDRLEIAEEQGAGIEHRD